MRKLIIIGILGILTSCKTVDCWQYCGTYTEVWHDTICIPDIHDHHYDEVNDSMVCFYVPGFECEIIDTLVFDDFKKVKVRKNKCK